MADVAICNILLCGSFTISKHRTANGEMS